MNGSRAQFERKLRGVMRRVFAVEAGPFTAIDFDRHRVHMVHADHRGASTRILKLASADVPADLNLADAAAVGAFLGEAVRKSGPPGGSGGGGSRGPRVVLCVPRSQAVLKPLVLPPADEAELAGMVHFQVEKDLPFKPDAAVIDFAVESHYDAPVSSAPAAAAAAGTPGTAATPGSPDAAERNGGETAEPAGIDVLASAVQHETIAYYEAVAAAAKLKLVRLGLRPYSDTYCVTTARLADRKRRGAAADLGEQACVALVHLTTEETEVDVMVGESLAFSRAIAIKLVSAPAPAPGSDEAPLAVSLDAAPQALIDDAARTLRSYQVMERDRKVGRILVAGGTGLEAAVAEAMAARLGVPAEVFDPLPALKIKPRDVAGSAGPGYLTALGLALGHRRAERLPFDFLHPKRPAKPRDEGRARTVARAALVAAAVLLAAMIGWLTLHQKDVAIAELTAQRDALKAENGKVVKLQKRAKALEAWHAGGRNWLDQWAMLSALFPPPADAYVTALRVNSDDSMSFTVRARASETISVLGEKLTAAGYDYKPGQVASREDPLGYAFSSDVRLTITPKVKIELASLKAPARPADDVSTQPPPQGGQRNPPNHPGGHQGDSQAPGQGDGQNQGLGQSGGPEQGQGQGPREPGRRWRRESQGR